MKTNRNYEYENLCKTIGIKPIQLDYPDNMEPFYPDFTAEKQLNLIKFLAKQTLEIGMDFNQYQCVTNQNSSWYHDTLDEALACVVNHIWKYSTESEKKEIRGILND